jgi:hypothetical protein
MKKGKKKKAWKSLDVQYAALDNWGDDSILNLFQRRNEKVKEYKKATGKKAEELRKEIRALTDEFNAILNTKLLSEFKANGIGIDEYCLKELKPFHWVMQFSKVFKNGGFDVVIENPPYLSPKEIKKGYSKNQINYLNYKYLGQLTKNGVCKFQDVYELFYYRSLELTKLSGYFGIISSDSFLTIKNFELLRRYLLGKNLIYWYPCPIDTFRGAGASPSVSTSIVILRNKNIEENDVLCYERPETIKHFSNVKSRPIPKKYFRKSIRKSFWIPTKENIQIYEKIVSKIKNKKKWSTGDIIPFRNFVIGYSRMETPNNSEFLAVSENDNLYVKNAKRYREKFGNKIEEYSKNKKLHGKIWKIISPSQIKEIKNLSDDEKENGTNKKWIKIIKGSGVAALEPNDRWCNNMHYYVNWDKEAIHNYNMAGKNLFWKSGIYWSLTTESKEKGFLINKESRLKFAIKEEGPNDVNFKAAVINNAKLICYLLGVLNTRLLFKIKWYFINSSTANQQCDINLLPIKIPTDDQKEYIERRVKFCIKMKKENLKNIVFDGKKYSVESLEHEIEKKVYEIYGL